MLKIGHRGAMGYEPENTLLSFKKAIQLNVDMIELDVHTCKTGELVVIHDNKVNRTTDGKGYVAKETLKELQSLDAGKGEKIPTLQEVFDLVDRKVEINIELKGRKTAEPVFKLIEEYIHYKNWSYDDFLISSFDHDELERFAKLNPNVRIGVLIPGIPLNFVEVADRLNAFSININLSFTDQEVVDKIHKKGFKVFVWTVNDLAAIERMKSLDVDGIFSNFPDRIKVV